MIVDVWAVMDVIYRDMRETDARYDAEPEGTIERVQISAERAAVARIACAVAKYLTEQQSGVTP